MVSDIDMRELESFYHVVREGSFSRAAQTLFLTQPTVSAHVAALERKLKVKLLLRTTKEIFLTDAGRLLYRYAGQILDLWEEAVQAVETFARDRLSLILIAASTVPGQYYLPRMIQRFQDRYPEARFQLELLDSGEVVEQVTARRVDLGFTGARIASPKCLYDAFAEDRLVVITPNTPRFQSYLETGFPVRQLAKENFIRREAGSGTRMETERFLRELGVNVNRLSSVMDVRSTERIKQMVSDGIGISVISESDSQDFCRARKLLAFHFDNVNLRRKLYLVRRKNHVLSPMAQAFCDDVLGRGGDGGSGTAGEDVSLEKE